MPQQPPIIFVHGNGDSSALWLTTVWRFASNGYPRELLHALDFPSPSARDDDDVPQANRSGTEEQRAFLAAEVETLLARTGAKRVALVGNSRGGNSIRNYVKHGDARG
jgi:triacylglycerol lipase